MSRLRDPAGNAARRQAALPVFLDDFPGRHEGHVIKLFTAMVGPSSHFAYLSEKFNRVQKYIDTCSKSRHIILNDVQYSTE